MQLAAISIRLCSQPKNTRPPSHMGSRKEGNGGDGEYVHLIEESRSVNGIVFTPYTYLRGEGYYDDRGGGDGESSMRGVCVS
jgi:hypothetical protein